MESRRLGVGRAAIAVVVVVVIVGAIGLVVAGPRSPSSTEFEHGPRFPYLLGLPTGILNLSEPIQVLASSVARLAPETSLNLNLNLTANANRSITVMAYDVNTLSRPNNITTALDWPRPVSACSAYLITYVVYQGDYSTSNYTQGTPLGFGGNVGTCPRLRTQFSVP